MQPFRVAVGDLRPCLEHLREADALLDSVPRTAAAERDESASERAAIAGIAGGVAAAAVIGAAGRAVGASTPRAAGELAEAVALLRTTVSELQEHPAAGELNRSVHRADSASAVVTAAQDLGRVVRGLHERLRQESGLTDIGPLTNWSENDEADDAAIAAAGVGGRVRAIKFAAFVVLVIAGYVFLMSR